jgi:hypothetical protein
MADSTSPTSGRRRSPRRECNRPLLRRRPWDSNKTRPEAVLVRLSPGEYRLLRFAGRLHGCSIPMRLRELGLADASQLLGLAPPVAEAAVEPVACALRLIERQFFIPDEPR